MKTPRSMRRASVTVTKVILHGDPWSGVMEKSQTGNGRLYRLSEQLRVLLPKFVDASSI